MTEAQVGFLYNIAAAISKTGNDNNTLLKSYYLMRCNDITRGYGLPNKHFSSKIRCPNCCIEWKNNTNVKVKPITLSKRQKQRLKSKQVTRSRKEFVRNRHNLLVSNECEQICSLCKKSTISLVLKPQKQLATPRTKHEHTTSRPKGNSKEITKRKDTKPDLKNVKTKTNAQTNMYSNAIDIFSMKNKNNILASTIKEKPKVINNNKRRKDKFAGLCQKAVLASAKLKEEKKKENSLNLFLKPSST